MGLFSNLSIAKKHERTPAEKSLVYRLDIFLMTFGCISQVIKYMDQQNISNAYVSGMKEDLDLYGNELNYFTTYFNIAYCICLIPSQIVLTYVRPSLWLPGLEILWGMITGLIAVAHNAKQVYILRAFLGAFESSAWPGMMTLLMHWYTPTELAKRMGFYQSCQAIGSMMSGAIQVAVIDTLEGKSGLEGWRWLFIIDAVITIVFAFFGFFMIPDTPNDPNPRAFWFNKEHADMAMERLSRHHRTEPKRITWTSVKRTFKSWVVYFIAILYIACVLGSAGYSYFSLFLKSLTNDDGTKTWTTSQINAIPIGGGAIQVAFVWIWAILSDYFQTRWTLVIAQALIGLIPTISMSIWTSHPTSTPISVAYMGYFISYLSVGTAPLLIAWLSDLLPQDPEMRSLIVGVTISGYYAIGAWSQVLTWPAVQAPYYKYGWQSAIAMWVLVIIMTCILRYIDFRWLLPARLSYIAENTPADDVVDEGSESDGKKAALAVVNKVDV